MNKPLVFISYAHEDKDWMEQVRMQLRTIEQLGKITIWDDHRIKPGTEWYPEIQDALNQAAVSICLVSAAYLASDFINREEIPALNERRKTEGMLIPVLIRPCAWKLVPWLKVLQLVPGEGQALSQLSEAAQDAALARMVEDIHAKLTDPAFQPAKPKLAWPEPEQVDTERLPKTGKELFGRTRELQLLDEAWDSTSFHVVSFVAWGGVGKSTLVNKWLSYMEAEHYRGAQRVYGWSFYSQGTNERVTSADQFINTALTWFGDPDMAQGNASPWDKGKRLAQLIREQKTLLLLDGLEPLQSCLDIEKGKIKDPALAVLIEELARDNSGLCVTTTRIAVPELDRTPDRIKSVDLDQISPEAGASLLRLRGVRGSETELHEVTRAFGCHALAVNLLAEYLHQIPGHAVSEAQRIPDLPDVSEDQGKHPRRIMEALVARYGSGPEAELMQVLGLFDRPTDLALIDAITTGNSIPGLTDHLNRLDQAAWLCLLQKLRSVDLLAPASIHAPQQIDCHPLVREHFGEKLRSNHFDAWREGHKRLYEHLCETTIDKKPNPTLEDLQPLYQAVAHGCHAGLQKEACVKVYRDRILRGTGVDGFYSWKKLGAFGSNLGALACFFETPWSHISPALTEVDQAWLLNETSIQLRALGRLTEALEPMRAPMVINAIKKKWVHTAVCAGNLSELELTLGLLAPTMLDGVEVNGAVTDAERSVTYAEHSGSMFERFSTRSTHADALHQAGRRDEAVVRFREAEAMQAQDQPYYPLLYSVRGFHYCDLLLSEAERDAGRKDEGGRIKDEGLKACRAVQQRAAQTLQWATDFKVDLLSIALDHLTLGRAALYEAILEPSSLDDCYSSLDTAVNCLRRAGTQDFLPLGLLTRAWLRLLTGARTGLESAQVDLDEAWEIAVRGSMKLHMADIQLYRARLFHDEATYPWTSPQADLAEARRLIVSCSYWRRKEELEDAETVIFGKPGKSSP